MLKINGCPMKKAADCAQDVMLDAAEVARTAAEAAGRKARSVLSRIRLEREIRDLQEEIDLQMQAVGEILYAAHKGSPSDSDCVQKILEYVDGLYEELEAHQREWKTLQGLLVCPACGAANESTNIYCQNCGRALSRE